VQIATQLSYVGRYDTIPDEASRLERAGVDLVWVAEPYGFDAVSLMGAIAVRTERIQIGSGILPLYTRTPSLLAMTAAGVDALSGGRCVLGIGSSGPQVIEGFHGVPFDRAVARTRETIEICRRIWRREEPLTNDGPIYPIPLPPGDGTGLGKPLKLITPPVRARIPIWVAALGERNVALTAELADGWLPLFLLPEKAEAVFGAALAAGVSKRAADLAPLEIAAGGVAFVGDRERARAILDQFARPLAALYIGGMGARGRNFYNELMVRYGYAAEAAAIQDLYLAGRRRAAEARVPDEFLELTNLCGTEGFVRDRIGAFRSAGVTVLNVTPAGDDAARLIDRIRTWAA
jgi:F420-dependent oxidoreductase-like protein